MITAFLNPEFFEPEESLIAARLKKAPKAEDPKSSVDSFVAGFQVPEDFEFLVRVLRKNSDLRIALYKAVRAEGYFPGCKNGI
jgi:hypothetical protein